MATDVVPSLKVFLSADIVGSTAFKQPFELDAVGAIASGEGWASVIQSFYKEIVSHLEESWAALRSLVYNSCDEALTEDEKEKSCKLFMGEKPHFWKTIGDEVLFWKDLETDFHLWFTLLAWNDAVKAVRTLLRKRGFIYKTVLDLKSTGWIAGFPVRNKEIRSIVPIQSRDGHIVNLEISDFIGPAIDVGFRISHWSTANRFSVGLDLAYLLSISGNSARFKEKLRRVTDNERNSNSILLAQRIREIRLFFSGTEYLKGVLGGLNYPKFWLDVHSPGSLEKLEEDLARVDQRPVAFDDVEAYCHKFYENRSKYIRKPFINDKDSVTYSNIFPGYKDLLDEVSRARAELGR